MTVLSRAVGLHERYACLWFVEGKMERAVVAVEELEPADDAPEAPLYQP